MKNFFFLSLLALLFCSCASRVPQSISTQKSYTSFRSEQKSFSTTQGTLRYIDKGPRKGKAILLLHGIPTSGWLYRHMIDDLAASGYRVIAPDMLGFGSSDSPKGYELYNEKNHAARLLVLMDSLGLKSWHHVCHDAGGLWTLALAERAPERIKSLTLLNSVLLKEGFNPPVRMKPGLLAKTAMAGYRNSITNNVMMGSLLKQGLEDCPQLTEVDREGYRRPLLEGKTDSLYYFFSKTCNRLPDYSSSLNRLASHQCPVQVIWGINDTMLLWNPQAAELKKRLHISPSDIHLLKANHFLQEEKPAAVSALIDQFVQR